MGTGLACLPALMCCPSIGSCCARCIRDAMPFWWPAAARHAASSALAAGHCWRAADITRFCRCRPSPCRMGHWQQVHRPACCPFRQPRRPCIPHTPSRPHTDTTPPSPGACSSSSRRRRGCRPLPATSSCASCATWTSGWAPQGASRRSRRTPSLQVSHRRSRCSCRGQHPACMLMCCMVLQL